jgi:hypothetical protein
MAFTAASVQPAVPTKGVPAYLAEFVGTVLLVLAITGVISAAAPAGPALLTISIVHALALMAIVYAIGSISGAHVNPAVTIALLTIRKITPRDAGGYLGAQIAGGVVGALLTRLFYSARGGLLNYGTPAVSPRYLHGGSVWLACSPRPSAPSRSCGPSWARRSTRTRRRASPGGRSAVPSGSRC